MRQFKRRAEELSVGATREQIRAVLGEPSRVTFSGDAEEYDEIWDFALPRRGCEFSIALKNGVYSHAWWGWNLERANRAN